MLKKVRVFIAVIVLSLMTFCFLDFAGVLPRSCHYWLPRIQFVPAILSVSIFIIAVLVILTLILGRIYCSVVCPMGIFQDLISRISSVFSKKRKKYAYSRAKNIFRWSVVGLVVITFLSGFTVVLALLDPYSAFGRMIVNVFRPIYMGVNNLLVSLLTRFDNYTLYKVDASIDSVFSMIVGILTFIILSVLAWKYGRIWCNTVCPVGTLLGVLSKYSLIKIRIDVSKCNHCGVCATRCKASCIDSKNQEIDYSRCVSCYNCIGACKQNALQYSLPRRTQQPRNVSEISRGTIISETMSFSKDVVSLESSSSSSADTSRRQFLTLAASAVAVSTLPKLLAQENVDKITASINGVKAYRRAHPLTPPGSISQKHFLKNCTSCHLCVSKCPSHVLKPAFKEYGLEGIMQPTMSFEKGFCNYDCVICGEVCPNEAIKPLSVAEKHLTQPGYVVFIKENCIVYREGTSCGACSEHCPTQAISMVSYREGLTIPQVDTSICVGCGGCEYVCPARPFRAVYIEGNQVQKEAKPIVEHKTNEIKIDDFGF